MLWYEAAAWGIVGVSALEALGAVAQLNFRKYYKGLLQNLPPSYSWRLVIVFSVIRVIIGGISCILVNQATPPLSIPAALFVGIGAATFLSSITRLGYSVFTRNLLHPRDKDRESQIETEAERLSAVRESYPTTPHGVSDEVADILAARREELAGQLPVVHPRDEGRASR